MAFVDPGTGRVIHGGIFAGDIVLSGTVAEGDLIGDSSGWKRSDANASPVVYAERVAGMPGVSGDTIPSYNIADISGYTGGTEGASLYLSDVAGEVDTTASTTTKQVVGKLSSATRGVLAPGLMGALATDVLISGVTMLSDWRKTGDLTKIDGAKVSAGTLTLAGLVNLTAGQIIVGSVANVPTAVAMSGVIALSNAGVTSIVAGSIVNADVSNTAAIAGSKLQALSLGVNAGVLPITGVANAHVAAGAAIDFSKLAALTNAHILVGSAANVATDVAVTGDVTVSNAGVTAIGAGKVTAAMLATAVQDAIPTCVVTVGAENANVITTTIQVKDAAGNDLAGRFYVRVSLCAAADATTLGTAPSAAVTATAGAIKRSVTAKTDLEVVTNTSGTFTFTAEEVGALTLYCSADLNGYQIMGSQAMTWGA